MCRESRSDHIDLGLMGSRCQFVEFRFKRTEDLPCNPVRDYPRRLAEEDPDTEDEVDLVHVDDLEACYCSDGSE